MSENPYTPPATKVADAAKPAAPTLPAPVMVAVVLLWVGVAFELLNWMRMIPVMNQGAISPINLLFGLCAMILTAVLTWKIMRGRNWARVVLLILQVLLIGNLIWSMMNSHAFVYLNSEMMLTVFLRPALIVIALVLLFGPGRAWFAPR